MGVGGIYTHQGSKDVVPKLEKGCNLTLNPHHRSTDVDLIFPSISL